MAATVPQRSKKPTLNCIAQYCCAVLSSTSARKTVSPATLRSNSHSALAASGSSSLLHLSYSSTL